MMTRMGRSELLDMVVSLEKDNTKLGKMISTINVQSADWFHATGRKRRALLFRLWAEASLTNENAATHYDRIITSEYNNE